MVVDGDGRRTARSLQRVCGQQPLYFDSQGNLLNKAKQNLTLTPPTPGASPINMTVDFSNT